MLEALAPEAKKPSTSRASVSVEGEGKTLTIRIRARDTSALRATLNSYLRWVALVRGMLEALTNLEKKKA
jgi:KEOPS complex subunit Pcc1